jgi:hypothetical protein
MILSTTTSGVASAAAACVFATALGACAAPADAAVDAAPLRVLVDLVRGSDDANGIAAEATRVAGLPVRYAAATSTTRHALTVECGVPERCAAALARLRSATTIYRAVEIDGRKTRSAS